jgi:pimeloyl-[acyl-carrier protein] methyl ester esterase
LNIPRESIHIECIKTVKPSLVLLHGWGTSGAVWRSWLPLLQEHYSVTSIDLPGLGGSVLEQENLTVDNVLDAIAPLIPDKSILLGWSLGGLIATLLAKRIADRILGLVTIAFNPSFVQQKDWSHAMDVTIFEGFQENIKSQEQATLGGFYKLQVLGGSQARPILKALKEINQGLFPSHLSDTLNMLRLDARAVLKSLQLPSLHIYGQNDRLVPVELVSLLPELSARISTLEIANAGHLPFISDAQIVTLELTKFTRTI